MSVASPQAPPSARVKRLALLGVVALVLAILGWRLSVYGTARLALQEGREHLEMERVADARAAFDRCLKSWPSSGEAHFLAARAARRSGDLDQAKAHLAEATANGWSPDDIKLERSLLRVQEGDFDAEEPYLIHLLKEKHPDSGVILEIVTPTYYGRYQLEQAKFCAAQWVELRPHSAKARNYQGEIFERLRWRENAVLSFREAVRLDPNYRSARINLATLVLEAKQPPDEAEQALAPLMQESPIDTMVEKLMIRCREAQGRYDEATVLADRMLSRDPEGAEGNLARGRIELEQGRAKNAIPYLRKANARAPHDSDVLFTLWRAVNEVGPPEEAAAIQVKMKSVQEDLQRLTLVTRMVVGDPVNPDLRREAGEICLRHGLEKEGLRWLSTALAVRPNHVETHRILADYYSRTNRPDLAAYHREQAAGPTPAVPQTGDQVPIPGRS